MITYIELIERLEYSGETGVFTWKAPKRKVKKGSAAGTKNTNGAVKIFVCGRLYSAHRLAWLYVYKVWPDNQIDHINGDESDNRISNLRCVSGEINARNRSKRIDNTNGYTGVTRIKTGRYESRISVNGSKKTLGYFDTAFEAHIAYEQEKLLHGYTKDHGIR